MRLRMSSLTSSNFAVASCPTPPVAPATSTLLLESCIVNELLL
jgi:hypothetical protein